VPSTGWEKGFHIVFESLQNFGAFPKERALAVMDDMIIIYADYMEAMCKVTYPPYQRMLN